ncbi:MAG: DUF4136 domain-containing protein [Desulforhopalus sp.]
MKYLVILSVLVTVLCGCHGVAVESGRNDNVKLAGLKTYRWLQTDTSFGDDVRVNNPEIITSVKKAVDGNLSKKGYQKIEDGEVDFLVNWFGAIETKMRADSIDKFYRNYGYGAVVEGAGVASTAGEDSRQFKEGTIVIDFLDPSNREILWRGTGTKRILEKGDEGYADLYINNVVKQILKVFPKAKN